MVAAALVVLFHVMGFVSSIHAVMSTRTSQGAIAWAVSLNTFPYLAVPAYWVLGRSKFQGYVVARRSKDDRNDRIEREAIETVEPYRVVEADREGAYVYYHISEPKVHHILDCIRECDLVKQDRPQSPTS